MTFSTFESAGLMRKIKHTKSATYRMIIDCGSQVSHSQRRSLCIHAQVFHQSHEHPRTQTSIQSLGFRKLKTMFDKATPRRPFEE